MVFGVLFVRFISFTMVLGVAFLLLVSLTVSAFLAGMVELLGEWQIGWIGHVINETLALIVTTLLFAMIFKFLPDVKIVWRHVWLGAFMTALFFVLGKFLIGIYIGHSGIASAYGAAGSFAVLLVWLYYSAQIFLFGAEFTYIQATRDRQKQENIDGFQHVSLPDSGIVHKDTKEIQVSQS